MTRLVRGPVVVLVGGAIVAVCLIAAVILWERAEPSRKKTMELMRAPDAGGAELRPDAR